MGIESIDGISSNAAINRELLTALAFGGRTAVMADATRATNPVNAGLTASPSRTTGPSSMYEGMVMFAKVVEMQKSLGYGTRFDGYV